MKNLTLSLVIMCGAVLISSCKSKEKAAISAGAGQDSINTQNNKDQNLARSVNTFTFRLYDQVNTAPENLIFSPFSISTALAMTGSGARGNTAVEMSFVLDMELGWEQTHKDYKILTDRINGERMSAEGQASVSTGGPDQLTDQLELSVVNALWSQEKYPFLDDYISHCQEYYAAEVRNLDFKKPGGLETSRKTINQWVEDQTNNKIEELIQPGILSPLTRLVLTNAVYFKATWLYPFKKDATTEGDFRLSDGQTARVDYMNQLKYLHYFENEDLQAVSLNYKGNQLAMLIVLPKEISPGKPGPYLSIDNYEQIISGLFRTDVRISLPKFRLETMFNLNEELKGLGMNDAFTDNADFSGMTGEKDLFIDFVIHKAFIEVNEAGTEAAAATAVGMVMKSGYVKDPVIFNADHPFRYMIYHIETGTIIFAGQFVNPDTQSK